MNKRFPDGFLWGSSTNAQQFEGGYGEGGKGLSIADKRNIPSLDQGDFEGFKKASDHYHRYKEDIGYYGEMGFSVYRFTIAWTRIFPNGDDSQVNQEGIDFYSAILDELEKYNITPVVTLYAYDLPYHLIEKYNGWLDRQCIEDYLRYVKTVVSAFKGRVKYWVPFNEQNHASFDSEYMTGYKDKNMTETFQIVHHFNLAYARATCLIHEIDKEAQVGANIGNACFYPKTCNPLDVKLADDLAYKIGYGNSDVYYRGVYTPRYLNDFKEAKFDTVILDGDMDIIKKSEPDFQSLTYYFSIPVDHCVYKGNLRNCIKDPNPFVEQTEWKWNIEAYGLKHLLDDYYHRYHLPILILENGLGYRDVLEENQVHDDYRIDFLRDHIKWMKKSIDEGVEVIGFLTWSAIDLYSTREGFEKRYGFVYVDKENHYQRIRKDSFYWYKNVIASHGENLD